MKRNSRDQFLADSAAFFAAHGMSPLSGRLFAHLLICEPAEQSFEMLCEAVDASRASVSTMTRLLTQMGLLERLPGRGRRLSYRLHEQAWTRLLEDDLASATRLSELARSGLTLAAKRPAEARRRLREMAEFYAFLEKHTAQMLKRWQGVRR
jgi:DNA-binding transcriptional regulator GbsR (MarR family)